MAGEGRNLRSRKGESSQSTDSKDKTSGPKRAPSTRSKKPSNSKKEAHADSAEGADGSTKSSEDVLMTGDEPAKGVQMTVVVPVPKAARDKNNLPPDGEGDISMGKIDKQEEKEKEEIPAKQEDQSSQRDPKEKAVSQIKINLALLERTVAQFDPRFTLRALRSISSLRKQLTPDVLARVIEDELQPPGDMTRILLAALKNPEPWTSSSNSEKAMDIDTVPGEAKSTQLQDTKDPLPERDIYLSILVLIYLHDTEQVATGRSLSSTVISKLRELNRRTLDALAARIYFYYTLFHEAPLPEAHESAPHAAMISIRPQLLAALRTAVLRKDQDTQATVITLLMRNYIATAHITQADLLNSHTQFPQAAPNNQVARYLYYLGRIRAIQLSYTEAHEHLTGATRKSPSTASAEGFYQAASKLLVVVELLMGDIPDRAVFRQPALERTMKPYFSLVQAVRIGKMEGFLAVVQAHQATFRRDGTYTLILRLRQNVIRTGVRMLSLSYAKISLRDICLKLDLESEESAEYIVAKAIRDGVIEATLDHEGGYMKSKEGGDVYATREPGEAFHERIRACLGLHNESVKAMRFPMNQHRLELKSAQEAREREREIAKDIVNGELDDEDGSGGDFEGM